MNCIYDIRGTNGSGKSTLVREILRRWKNVFIQNEEIPYHYVYGLNLCIMGGYAGKGSGVDNVKGSDRLQKFMWSKLEDGHNVLLEGVIVSHIFGRWNEMAHNVKAEGYDYKFYYMDVPVEVAIERVKDRREAAGKDREYDPHNTIKFQESILRVVNKLEEEGHEVTRLSDLELDEEYDWLMSDILDDLFKQWQDPYYQLDHSVLDLRGNHGSGKTTYMKRLCKGVAKVEDELISYRLKDGIAYLPNFSKKIKDIDVRYAAAFLHSILERYNVVLEGVNNGADINEVLVTLTGCTKAYTILLLDETKEECFRRKNIVWMHRYKTPYDRFKIVQYGKNLAKIMEKYMKTKAAMLVETEGYKERTEKRIREIIENFS